MILIEKIDKFLYSEDIKLKLDFFDMFHRVLKVWRNIEIDLYLLGNMCHKLYDELCIIKDDSWLLFRFLRSIVLLKVYLEYSKDYKKKSQDAIPNGLIKGLLSKFFEVFSSKKSPRFEGIELLEILIILKNNQKIRFDLKDDLIICTIRYIEDEIVKTNRHYSQWIFEKLILQLSTLKTFYQNEEFIYLISKLLDRYWNLISEKRHLNYQICLRIIKFLLSINYEAFQVFIKNLFLRLYEDSRELSFFNSTMKMQFILLGYKSKIEFHWDWDKIIFESFYKHGTKNICPVMKNELEEVLDNFSPGILGELDNGFYYEIDYSYPIPGYLLDGCILHRKDD